MNIFKKKNIFFIQPKRFTVGLLIVSTSKASEHKAFLSARPGATAPLALYPKEGTGLAYCCNVAG